MSSVVYTCDRPGAPVLRVERDNKDNVKSRVVTLFPGGINHSPEGANWGYSGSGPAQCAAAILWDYKGETIGRNLYQRFKSEVLAGHPNDHPLVLPGSEIDKWLEGVT